MSKKNGGRRPMINLKSLNNFLPFQNGGPTLTKGLVAIEWLHKQNRLEEFLILHSTLQKLPEIYTCSMGKGPARCFCFGLGPVTRIFIELLKIPIAVLRTLKIRVIVYLDNMLLMSHMVGEISKARNTLIFLLEHLGFVTNIKNLSSNHFRS